MTLPCNKQMTDHMASHGVAVVVFWSITLPLSSLEKLEILKGVFDWTHSNLNRALHNHGVPQDVSIDFENIVSELNFLRKTKSFHNAIHDASD